MVYDPRRFKAAVVSEQKSLGEYYSSGGVSFSEYLLGGGNGDLSAHATILLYEKAMPFFDAVTKRAQAFARIPVRVWDKKKKEFVPEHPILDLLSNPNADLSQEEFLEQIASFYDITGESFVGATGRIEKPPLEIFTVSPVSTTFGVGNKFGMLNVPDSIMVSTAVQGSLTYRAEDNKGLGLRFINQDDRELWHIRSFNPRRSASNFRGLSKARPLWLELQQYIAGNTTNLSMLKRGTRLSMAWVNNRGEALTDTQWERMQEEAQKYAGDANAGGTPILDGMDVKNMQATNRDMEFRELQETMYARISTAYNIPLALLLTDVMTLNNFETSVLQFFDGATLPLANRIYGELTRFLMPRYKDSENLELRYNENDISALRLRMVETAEKMGKVGVNTDDEIRTIMGYEGLASGGNVIYKPANLIPVGDDAFTGDELTKPGIASKYRELLRERGYEEKKIDQLIKEQGL